MVQHDLDLASDRVTHTAGSVGKGNGFTYELFFRPSSSLAVLQLEQGANVAAEAGAMVAMSSNIEMKPQVRGGFLSGLKRAASGDTAFISIFSAEKGAGEVMIAPHGPGDIVPVDLDNQEIFVQTDSYLASDTSLEIDTKWQGAAFFSAEGIYVLRIKGTGLLLLDAFGAIYRKHLKPGEHYIVDTGHLVAWEGKMEYRLRKATTGFFKTMVSGECYVADFIGPGEVLIQSRNPGAFGEFLTQNLTQVKGK